MKVLIITCSPNKNGLTAACSKAAKQGIINSKGKAEIVRLNDFKIAKCIACKNGWGSCKDKGFCQVLDDFQAVHKQVSAADGFIVVTPVYWCEISESAKTFFDRLRRCEAMKEKNRVQKKPFICIAAAGGSGRGTINCLAVMEKIFLHMNNLQFDDLSATACDFIGVTQHNRSYMLDAIQAAAEKMVSGSLEKNQNNKE
jgi:multimeric flavodoxin WrbA